MAAWLIYALLSAAAAALVSIFGKIGLQNIDANAATAIRAVIMALFLLGVIAVQGKFGQLGSILAQKKHSASSCSAEWQVQRRGCSIFWPSSTARCRR